MRCGKAALSVAELCWAVVLVRQFTCDVRETVMSDTGHRGESNAGIFVPKTIRSLEHSFPGPFVPETENGVFTLLSAITQQRIKIEQ